MKTMTASEILRNRKNANQNPITDFISEDGYVWKMILSAMQEYSDLQHAALIEENERLKGEPIQDVSIMLNSEGNYQGNSIWLHPYDFTPDQLRAIANHIELNTPKP